MANLIFLMQSPLIMLSLAVIGILLFVIILKTLKEISLFGDGAGTVIAVCVTILCLIGVYEFIISPGGAIVHKLNPSELNADKHSHFGFHLILLPYASLAITLLLLMLLLRFKKFIQPGKEKRSIEKEDASKEQQINRAPIDDERRFR